MQPDEIFSILNRHVFDEEKSYLIQNLTENYARFVGIFRSTTPRLKIIQNLLQSREIRFGDALEEIISALISDMGYINLDRNLVSDSTLLKRLRCDQYFASPDSSRYFLVEQKVRDDHDSSKKSGQIENFERKLRVLYQRHGNQLVGVMYFIDPSLTKNRRYYAEELSVRIGKNFDAELWLCYNGELFERLRHPEAWEVLETSLIQWRDTVKQDIPLNYDLNPIATVAETQSIAVTTWFSLAANDLLWSNGVIECIFPTGEALRLIANDIEIRFSSTPLKPKQRETIQLTVDLLRKRIREHYKISP